MQDFGSESIEEGPDPGERHVGAANGDGSAERGFGHRCVEPDPAALPHTICEFPGRLRRGFADIDDQAVGWCSVQYAIAIFFQIEHDPFECRVAVDGDQGCFGIAGNIAGTGLDLDQGMGFPERGGFLCVLGPDMQARTCIRQFAGDCEAAPAEADETNSASIERFWGWHDAARLLRV